jgi:hypothetical protein
MSNYLTIRSGASAITEAQLMKLVHDIVEQSGVYDIATSWDVSEHNPQNRTVDVAVGAGFLKLAGITYHGYSDAVNNVSLTANSSGNPRIDSIVVYADLAADPTTDTAGVLKFAAVAGTPATSPTAPDASAIETAVGAGNPYLVLANVAVANGASTLANANITDMRVSGYMKFLNWINDTTLRKPKVKGSYSDYQSLQNQTGTVTLDCDEYNNFQIECNDAITIALDNDKVGQVIYIDLISNGETVTLPAGIKWSDNVAPVFTTTAGKIDSIALKVIGTGAYLGFISGQNM